jgi:hypothetical protein
LGKTKKEEEKVAIEKWLDVYNNRFGRVDGTYRYYSGPANSRNQRPEE